LVASIAALTFCFLTQNGLDSVFGGLLAVTVLYIAAVDVGRFEIPDVANIVIFILGLLWNTWALTAEDAGIALLRGVAAAALLLVVRTLYRRWRNIEGLGLGDVKLAAAGAIWLTTVQMWFALSIAVGGAVFLIIARRLLFKEEFARETAIPFGAFLAPAIWVAWILQIKTA